ncbi:unnamed protein product [Caenorhabditis sp. 36 PRJEB53466]|nr:unnamed protein product [Caenorhabditis sp. 36 PRJEB53466]
MIKWQDGVQDCYDASDEVCLPWQFDCQFGSPRCVSKNKLNDLKIDCYSGFDEGCPAHFYVCKDKSTCIPPEKYLDGRPDCKDRSDEPCVQNEFQCSDGSKCIPRAQFQDGKEDCADGSDEECTTSQFACQCGAVRCVAEQFVMDGSWDCEDGSDEFVSQKINCTGKHHKNTGINSFSLGKIKICSGLNPCKPELGQVCVVIGGTWRCVCKLGTVRPPGSEKCIPMELLARFRSSSYGNCSESNENLFGLLQASPKVFEDPEALKKPENRWMNIRRAPRPKPRKVIISGSTPNGIDGFLENESERVPFMFLEEQKEVDYVSAIPDEIIDSYGTITTPTHLEFSRDEPPCTGNASCGHYESCQLKSDGTFGCLCRNGFFSVNGTCIELIDECLRGQHDCHSDARCVDALVGYECLCREGYLDTSREPKARPGRSCRKLVNECLSASLNDCAPDAKCLDKPIGYTCRCQDDYVDISSLGARKPGRNCTKAVNECATNVHNCDHRAICHDLPIGYSCRCPFGFIDMSPTLEEQGRKCVIADDDCSTCSLIPGARCLHTEDGANCACLSGYVDVRRDPESPLKCQLLKNKDAKSASLVANFE